MNKTNCKTATVLKPSSNLAGQRFGRWTVLDSTMRSASGEIKWLCRCDCGTERYVLARSLCYNGSQSCGCKTKENARRANAYDLLGKNSEI